MDDSHFTPFAEDAPPASSTIGAIVFVLQTASLTNSRDFTPGTKQNVILLVISNNGSNPQQAYYTPMVGCTALQSHPLSAMENLLIQCSSKALHIPGPYRRLLPCCTRLRLGIIPQEHNPIQTTNTRRHASPCGHSRASRFSTSSILRSKRYHLQARALEVRERNIRKVRRSRNYPAHGHR